METNTDLKPGMTIMFEGKVRHISYLKKSVFNENMGFPVYFSNGNYIWSDQIFDCHKNKA